jgi:hypothetical protein
MSYYTYSDDLRNQLRFLAMPSLPHMWPLRLFKNITQISPLGPSKQHPWVLEVSTKNLTCFLTALPLVQGRMKDGKNKKCVRTGEVFLYPERKNPHHVST